MLSAVIFRHKNSEGNILCSHGRIGRSLNPPVLVPRYFFYILSSVISYISHHYSCRCPWSAASAWPPIYYWSFHRRVCVWPSRITINYQTRQGRCLHSAWCLFLHCCLFAHIFHIPVELCISRPDDSLYMYSFYSVCNTDASDVCAVEMT